jgi:hypothetical protein
MVLTVLYRCVLVSAIFGCVGTSSEAQHNRLQPRILNQSGGGKSDHMMSHVRFRSGQTKRIFLKKG